jgi:hypothetical protein
MLVAVKNKGLEELEFTEVNLVVVKIGDSRFRLRVDSEGSLIINKYGGEDSCIRITPAVSNEIWLT